MFWGGTLSMLKLLHNCTRIVSHSLRWCFRLVVIAHRVQGCADHIQVQFFPWYLLSCHLSSSRYHRWPMLSSANCFASQDWNRRILSEQHFTAWMPLLTASCIFGFGRRCYLCRLCTMHCVIWHRIFQKATGSVRHVRRSSRCQSLCLSSCSVPST